MNELAITKPKPLAISADTAKSIKVGVFENTLEAHRGAIKSLEAWVEAGA